MIAKKSFKKEVLKNSKKINLEEKIKLQCNARFLAEYFGFKNASSVSNAINLVKKNLEDDDRAMKVRELERRVVGW